MSNEDIMAIASEKMQRSVDALQLSMTKIRTGRANASLLDQIHVSCYGSDTPLNQVASVSVSDSRTLLVTPWDKSLVTEIEKAIYASDLGLNPVLSGDTLRVPIPQLTEERRRDLVKIIKEDAESSRVSVRQFRREANASVKHLIKDKVLNEDEGKKAESDIQDLTDRFIKQIDHMFIEKEKEIMTV